MEILVQRCIVRELAECGAAPLHKTDDERERRDPGFAGSGRNKKTPVDAETGESLAGGLEGRT